MFPFWGGSTAIKVIVIASSVPRDVLYDLLTRRDSRRVSNAVTQHLRLVHQ